MISSQRIRVLVIEDNPGDARLIEALLSVAKTASFQVESCDTLAAGIAKLAAEPFDAVLLDPGLPDSQGLETFLQLHEHQPGIPIVVLSGLGDDEVGLRAVQAGAQDYLVKGDVETNVLERSIRYALERKRAAEAIRQHTEELRNNERLLRKMLDLQERERQLLAYDIHDGFVQDVVGAKMMLDGLDYRLQSMAEQSRVQFDQVRELLNKAIDEGRRMISELRPLIIDEQGIIQAINYLVGEEQSKGGIEIHFEHQVQFDRLPRLLEGTVFRIVQEALTNVKRHSQANAASVNLTHIDERVFIEVQDQGVGFDLNKVSEDRFGIRGIRERARLFGGKATIESSPGQGARVFVELPLAPPTASA